MNNFYGTFLEEEYLYDAEISDELFRELVTFYQNQLNAALKRLRCWNFLDFMKHNLHGYICVIFIVAIRIYWKKTLFFFEFLSLIKSIW